MGDLDSYFANVNIKKIFLNELYQVLDDDIPRFFVPQVNSSDNDLEKNSIGFP